MDSSTQVIMIYYVRCYPAPFESTATDDLERATTLCVELGAKYGLTEVLNTSGEYNSVVMTHNSKRFGY